jgi:hypothetical protein
MSTRPHFFNFHANRWYDEEFNGPLDATTYLDPETGNLYLEVREGDFPVEFDGESWIVHIDPVFCRLDKITASDIPCPPEWSAYECEIPTSLLPLKTRATSRTKYNPIDAPWQSAW